MISDSLDPTELQAKLATHVGATRAGSAREEYLADCTAQAIDLIVTIVGDRQVPKSIAKRAVIEAAADLFWRQQARSGVQTFEAEGALETVRVGLDPTRSARALLAPFLGQAIA